MGSETGIALPYSRRIRKPTEYPGFIVNGKEHSNAMKAYVALFQSNMTPNSVQEALGSPESPSWKLAMKEEMESFSKNNVWTLVPAPAGAKIVGHKWVFKLKEEENGTPLYRARLVAKGFSQSYGIDYFETYAPVVRRTTLRMLFAVSVNFDLKISHFDVKTAFLYGDLTETVFMSQPEGFVMEGEETLVCKLSKAVYGLKQSARSWYKKADNVLKNLDFINFRNEPCVYIKKSESSVIIIALYVDDFYIFYSAVRDKKNLLEALQAKFKVKDLGEAKNCLGIKLIRNWSKGTLILQQEDYINVILDKFNMQNCKGAATPMEFRLKMENCKADKSVKVPYQELMGCLLYLSTNTRPDIAFVVSFLSQFNTSYTDVHWSLAKRVLSYLKSTSKLGLKYIKAKKPTFCLVGYADADWAGSPSSCSSLCKNSCYKSYSGFCFTLDSNLISWESKKQKLAAQSSTESEYICISEAVKESIYLNEMVSELFDIDQQNVLIFNDNQSAIKVAYSEGFSARTKHMGVRKQLVRDCINDGDISLDYMSTDEMPADLLTKALAKTNHYKCCTNLRLATD